MILIEPNGRPYVFCPKCKTNVVLPPSLSPEEKSTIAAEVRASPVAAVKLNHERFGLNLREAKALAFHVTKKRGECYRCHRPLQDEVSICEQCHSANLDW
jgi:Zn finger protein HypA/HybF involved in hydrogenase expression